MVTGLGDSHSPGHASPVTHPRSEQENPVTATETTLRGLERADTPLPFLAHTATDLLALAKDAALPLPRSMRVSQVCQQVTIGFPEGQDSLHALAQWAQHFGAAITGRPNI